MKITFMGAGSSVFAKNVLGDVLLTPALRENLEIALYDIDGVRLEESYLMIDALNKKYNEGKAKVEKYLGVDERRDALRGARFVVNAIQAPSSILRYLRSTASARPSPTLSASAEL